MILIFKYFVVLCAVLKLSVNAESLVPRHKNALDLELYEKVIDLEQCDEQLAYITKNNTLLLLHFLDVSFKIPRNILEGNLKDTGSYFSCLNINHQAHEMNIQGKYSVVHIPFQLDNIISPLSRSSDWPTVSWPGLNELAINATHYNDEVLPKLASFNKVKHSLHSLLGSNTKTRDGIHLLKGFMLELAMCIPQVCTGPYFFDVMSMNLTKNINLTIEEVFVRLPNDKHWVAADYVAVTLFSIIGFLTLFSTAYDLWYNQIQKKDPHKIKKMLTFFSVYSNAKAFNVYPSSSSVITCLDGVRSFAMIWVIVGHTYSTLLDHDLIENYLDAYKRMQTLQAVWITSAPITVDTFFMMSGLLLVYISASKLSKMTLLKKLHLFYLNRILRMFPVLAALILIQASFLQRTADGPYWDKMMTYMVNSCRVNWWTTLLYVQNWVNMDLRCLPHTWYLAIDMQLHIVSPLMLYWILGKRSRRAWVSLVTVLLLSLTGAAIYNFINNFQSAIVTFSRPPEDADTYKTYYYFNTLNRVSPFVVGMIFGYLLHINRGKTVQLPKVVTWLSWIVAMGGIIAVLIAAYVNIQADWDNQLADNFINSTIRPVWAACVGWIVFACHHGYGGPVNWLLSLHVFKILGRLSYAMYLVHYPITFLINATILQPIFYSASYGLYKFYVDFVLSVIGAYLLTITIEYPFTHFIKMVLGEGEKLNPKKTTTVERNPELEAKGGVSSQDHNF